MTQLNLIELDKKNKQSWIQCKSLYTLTHPWYESSSFVTKFIFLQPYTPSAHESWFPN